jgi:hypothetical protein
MSISKNVIAAISMVGFLGLPTLALAQVEEDTDANEQMTEAEQDAQPLPEPKADDDPAPPVAMPNPPQEGIVRQAGVGGTTGYGRAGVLELGGFAGLTAASGFTTATINPTIGWFFADNMQISGILGLSHVRTEEDSATMVSALVEPSYHLPFNRTTFGFLGLGLGVAHAEDQGLGFAMAPRIGANVMVGRSGVLTPSLSYQYTSHESVEMENLSYVAMTTALTANIGYTVMW